MHAVVDPRLLPLIKVPGVLVHLVPENVLPARHPGGFVKFMMWHSRQCHIGLAPQVVNIQQGGTNLIVAGRHMSSLQPHRPAGTLGFEVASPQEKSILRKSLVFEHAALQLGQKEDLLQGAWAPWEPPAVCSTVMEPVHSKENQADVGISKCICFVHVCRCTISLPLYF